MKTIFIKTEWQQCPWHKSNIEFQVDDEKAYILYNKHLESLRRLYACGYYLSYTIRLLDEDGTVLKRWRNYRLTEARFINKRKCKERIGEI